MGRTKVIILVIVLCIAAGMFGGYRIWGTRGEGEGDIKQMLRNVEEEVVRIEQKNKDLVASIEASQKDIAASEAVNRENQELKNQLQVALQKIQGLESALADWKTKETDAQKRAEVEQGLRTVQEELKKKIAALEGGSQDLTVRLQQAEQQIAEKEGQLAGLRSELAQAREKAIKGEEFKQLSRDLNARISELEKENQGLRSAIDNISEITKQKLEAR